MVPVASWVSVWSIFSAISSPGRHFAIEQVIANELVRHIHGHDLFPAVPIRTKVN